MHKQLAIGSIVGVHGIRGTLKVKPYAHESTLFSTDRLVQIEDKFGQKNNFTVDWAEPYKKGFRLGLKEVNGRSQAEALVGGEIFIDKEDLPVLEEGTYYWFDLIGLTVWTTDNQMIGRVDAIIETGSNDVYVVKQEDIETLVPALESVVLGIDLNRQTMRVKLPEGL